MISAAVSRFSVSSSQRQARQIARIKAPVSSGCARVKSRRMTNPFSGGAAQIATPGSNSVATPCSTALEAHGSPTQKASTSPAAMAAAISGGGTVTTSGSCAKPQADSQ